VRHISTTFLYLISSSFEHDYKLNTTYYIRCKQTVNSIKCKLNEQDNYTCSLYVKSVVLVCVKNVVWCMLDNDNACTFNEVVFTCTAISV